MSRMPNNSDRTIQVMSSCYVAFTDHVVKRHMSSVTYIHKRE